MSRFNISAVTMEPVNRRELKTRSRAWPRALARGLARAGATPNAVSIASIIVAAGAAASFCVSNGSVRSWRWLIAAAAGIQLRLLCNLLDGLLAIEGGLKSRTGDLYNEVPDRIADVLILLSAGVAVEFYPFGIWLGVGATIAALLTAYVRLLGGSLGFAQDFRGPMAKQHRMFTLTLGALGAAVEQAMRGTVYALWAALIVITLGATLTFVLRLVRIGRALEQR